MKFVTKTLVNSAMQQPEYSSTEIDLEDKATNTAGAPTVEASPSAANKESSDEIHSSILEMKRLVGEVTKDSGSTISRLDKVQDRLIDNLESLNKRIENYIELLANQRKSA